MEDPEEYYDVDDGYDEDDRADDQNNKKVAYPPRLMVDFTSLGMNALLRYAQFYQITVRDDCEKEELAAVVARHFDCTLEVEEDESIVSFMQRIRNGEKSVVRHRPPEKAKHADKKRKKSNSNSRKRQRGDAPVANGKDAKDGGGAAGSNGGDAKSSSGAGSKTADLHDDDQPLSQVARPLARSKPSGPPSGSSNAASGGSSSSGREHPPSSGDKGSSSSSGSGKNNGSRSKNADSKKKGDNDNGEDNELYCICNLPSYGNMIACDGKKCPNPSQWYHLECVGFSDGRHPDTWLCPECDPKGFADFKSKKKKSKQRSKSPGSK